MSNAPAIVRTTVPYIVGAIVGALVALGDHYGIAIPADSLHEVVAPAVSGVAATLYYAAGRFLETRVPARARKFGRLLLTWGLTRHTPAYIPASDVDAARQPRVGA